MKLVLNPNSPHQRQYDLQQPVVTLGKSADSTIILQSAVAAEYHARIYFENGTWFISDFVGNNTVVLNGEPVQNAALTQGSMLSVGGEMMLVMSLDPVAEQVYAVPMAMSDPSPQITAYDPAMARMQQGYGGQEQPTGRGNTIMARMALICSLCGPLLFGIGWLLGS